ncbi:uncharacterized protein LOC110097477 [Dendrobium catenatum]|uniref:uncharacterized protein LOC110097477 n=1 Tax=Dendrobium catenatum TaxID=906689 RepID=UPI0009F50795|nr:uncharacterized protein LOC110097477 [Dendrobium catenatum]
MVYKNYLMQNQDCGYWKCLKSIKLKPRVEVFWWRVFNNAIPMHDFLYQRRMQEGFICPRGCGVKEDVEHITTNCGKLKEVIGCLNKWGFGISSFQSFQDCWKWMDMYKDSNGFLVNVYCNAVYFVWRSRNKFIRGGKEDCSTFMASSAVSYASISYMVDENLGNWGTNQSFRLLDRWYPPPPNWIKINVDAALLKSYKAGIGGVVRDSEGRFLLAYGHSCTHWDISKLELMAVHFIRQIQKEWMQDYNEIAD